jgi:DNA replication initiation complex subunit (GINS family)
LNYEDLRKIQRLEKASSKLIDVEPNFFFELGNFLKDLESKAKSMEEVKLLENTRKIARDVYERREQKVVVRALRAARTGDLDTEGMTEREKKQISELIEILKKYRGDMFPKEPEPKKKKRLPKAPGEVQGSGAPSKQEEEIKVKEVKESKKEEKKQEVKEEKDLLKVRVSKYIPQFITSQGKFGPYAEGAEVSLPKEVCNVLVKKRYVEVIE